MPRYTPGRQGIPVEACARVLEQMRDPLIVLDRDGQIEYLNPAAEQLVGQPAVEIVGRDAWDAITRLFGTRFATRAREAGRAGRLSTFEVLHQSGAGWFEVCVYPLGAVAGQQLDDGLVLHLRDVTPRKRAEEERRASDRRLEQFLAVLAHDLREPAGVLGTSVAMLRETLAGQAPAAIVPLLPAIESANQRMLRLIGDLLDATRIGAGRLTLRPQETELVALMQSLIEQQRMSGVSQAIHFEGPPTLTGTWDPERLTQLFRNLISNAIEYSPAASRVDVRVRPADDTVLVAVADQGPGLGREQIGQLFQRFSRLESSGGTRGTGLGLYIARAIAAAHGGRLWVESAPGRGSTFNVLLPMEPAGEIRVAARPPRSGKRGPVGSPRRVLDQKSTRP